VFKTQTDVFANVQGFQVRVKDQRQGDANHIVEVKFDLPLTRELASDILEQMAFDLFQEVKDDVYQPKQEMQQAKFSLPATNWRMQVRTHPDVAPEVTVDGVGIRKLLVTKVEAGTWLLTFTAMFTMGGEAEAVAFIRWLKKGVYLTLVAIQKDLLDAAEAAPAAEKQAALPNAEDQAAPTPAKGKRRGRSQAPEAERQAQAAEGKRLQLVEKAEPESEVPE
jgi:hypothetical protein